MQVNMAHQLVNFQQRTSENKFFDQSNQASVEQRDLVTISPDVSAKAETTKEIMKDYDLKNISYSSLEEMGGKLRDSGVISDYEFLIILAPPSATMPDNAVNILEGEVGRSDVTTSHNMITHLEKMLEMQKEFNASDKKSIEIAQRRVDLIHYLNNLT